MITSDIDAAIAAALSLDWQKALEINNKILAECPDDLDCLNRIGKAYMEIGDYKKAALIFKKALKINKYDQIASRNLARVTQTPAPKKSVQNSKKARVLGTHLMVSFLEEPGKTKVINLVNLAPAKTLLTLNNADAIVINPKRHTVFLEDEGGTYLGALPDDLAHRLLILMKGGNKYEGFVKSCSKNTLTVFLKEVTRAKRFHNTPSFPASGGDYLSFVRDETESQENKPASGEAGSEEVDAEEAPFKHTHHNDEEEEESWQNSKL